MQCIDFLAATTAKIVEKSPLKYVVVRAISCFVSRRIASNCTLSEKRMALLVQILYERNHFMFFVCDCAKVQFSNLCGKASSDLKGTFEAYSPQDTCLDAFYCNIIGKNSEFADLWSVLKCVFILSHGNASVESGFSINGEMLVENLCGDSLIAQHQVYDAVLAAGGITAVKVDKSMLQYVCGDHSACVVILC